MAEKTYLVELTQAELAATEIIRSAQELRDKRLKEAKFDAEQELGTFRTELDKEYAEATAKDAQGVDPELLALQREYKQKSEAIFQTFNKNKADAIEFLVTRTFDVNIEVPKVVIGKFE